MIIKEKITDEDTDEIIEKSYFTTIKSLSRLFCGSRDYIIVKTVIVHLNQKKN